MVRERLLCRVKGLRWLNDPDVDVSRMINRDDVIFLRLHRDIERLKLVRVTASLETAHGAHVSLPVQPDYGVRRHCRQLPVGCSDELNSTDYII